MDFFNDHANRFLGDSLCSLISSQTIIILSGTKTRIKCVDPSSVSGRRAQDG